MWVRWKKKQEKNGTWAPERGEGKAGAAKIGYAVHYAAGELGGNASHKTGAVA